MPLQIYLTSRDTYRGNVALAQLQSDTQLHAPEHLGTEESPGLVKVSYYWLDVTVPLSPTAFSMYLKLQYPAGIDILVNNAGIAAGQSNLGLLDSTMPYYGNTRIFIPYH